MEISTVRCLGKQIAQLQGISRSVDWYPIKRTQRAATKNTVSTIRSRQPHPIKILGEKCRVWRTFAMPASLEESAWLEANGKFIDDENPSEDVGEEEEEHLLGRPLSKVELQALLSNSERRKLITKLSEANQQNRFLKRQLYVKEDALLNFKRELALMELEVQGLVALAEEIAKAGIPVGSRKINGKYIQSHLLLRLEGIHRKLQEQIKDVDVAQSKEVHLFWIGVAESVQVMGSFDGWSQGEHMSPEYTGSYTKFSTVLMLRPGRYEIKFLVDGEYWHLSPEFPTVGEGLTENNLLIVD